MHKLTLTGGHKKHDDAPCTLLKRPAEQSESSLTQRAIESVREQFEHEEEPVDEADCVPLQPKQNVRELEWSRS